MSASPVVAAALPAARLWAGDLSVEHHDDTLSISVGLQWEGAGAQRNLPSGSRLRIDVGDLDRLGGDRRHLLAAHTPANATALVPLLALLAAASGADLSIEAPVCPVALAGARRAVAAGQATHGWASVTLGATAGATSPTHRGGDGVLFSLGLEPLATVARLRRSDAPPTHLIALDDLDSPVATSSGGDERAMWRAEAVAAHELHLPLVRVSTNARDITDHLVDWDSARRVATSACALALAGVVGSVTLPADRCHADPDHPGTSALWSSGAVSIDTAMADLSSIERAALVAADPWACQWLRVCDSRRADSNCGRCRSCQLALAQLWLSGEPTADAPWFEHGLDPMVVASLTPAPLPVPADYLTVVDELHEFVHDTTAGTLLADPGDRSLAVALAGAWVTHLGNCGVAVPTVALSA